ncbi:MAG: glutathione synthase [Lachnospiraceae bacterium]|nr:glutathione synthase [Lachnospiraceae bacterium]
MLLKSYYGLERETLRIDCNGRLASTPHPFDGNDSITKDFCENHLEIVTPVYDSIDKLMGSLKELDGYVRNELAKTGESLWMYSNPPHFEDESEILIAKFSGPLREKTLYRNKIGEKYGKRIYLLSGVHFNISFDDKIFRQEYYLKLYRQLYVHSWLLLLLTAASPLYDRSLYADGERGIVRSDYSSIRNSETGFWNKFTPVLNYDNLNDLVSSLKYYIDNGSLFSLSELYLPVRLKPKGKNHVENFENGISHIELRLFDINPFEPLGVDILDLKFTDLLIKYLWTFDDFVLTPELQKKAIDDHKKAALYDLSGVKIDGEDILEKADEIIGNMAGMFSSDSDALDVLQYERQKLNERLCTKDMFQ